MPELPFADELQRACLHCSVFARAKVEGWWKRQFVPEPEDPSATVTFIAFEGRTYAVTAGHVIQILQEAAIRDGADPEGYFLPVAPGIGIGPPFVRPPKPWTSPAPDVAIRPIDAQLPPYIGKKAFILRPRPVPNFPVPYALAVGFPTKSKFVHSEPEGDRVAMQCVHAVAEGVGSSAESDQVQFWSKLSDRPSTISLSGLSGGPAFWSDGTLFGLLGFVKEALDVNPKGGGETVYDDPHVHFLCQRASYEIFSEWAAYVDLAFPRERDALNRRKRR